MGWRGPQVLQDYLLEESAGYLSAFHDFLSKNSGTSRSMEWLYNVLLAA